MFELKVRYSARIGGQIIPTVGPMAGGCYIYSMDSRFGAKLRELGLGNSYVAIPLHDRFETSETAKKLSV